MQASTELAIRSTECDNNILFAGFTTEQESLAAAATNNDAQAGANAVSIATNALSQAATGNVVGGVVSAIAGGFSAYTGWSAARNSNTVSMSNSITLYNANLANNSSKMGYSNDFTLNSTNIQNNYKTQATNLQNNASTSIASNNASLIRTNAANTKTTADANANRSRDTAYAAVQASLNQAGTRPPIVYGSRSGTHPVTRPRALIAQIVKQPRGAIACAGDTFLRYGYMLHQQWQIEKLQVMKHFTYWKLEEVWCSGSADVLEGAQQAIKDIMTAGVTVWSDPDEIGKVGIHDNY